MKPTELQLDPSRLELTADGVEGYFLPIGRPDVVAVRDHFVRSALSSARDLASGDRSIDPLASSAFLGFAAEFLSVAEASVLFTRTLAAGASISLPVPTYYWGPITAGQAPELGEVDRALRAPHPKPWRAPFRLLRNSLIDDGIERVPANRVDLTSDIVATSVGGLVSRRARLESQRVVYLPLSTWFGSLDATTALSRAGTRLVDSWIEDCKAAMTAIKETLPDHLLNYLRNWLSRFLGVAETHWARLQRHPELLPRRLWIGAGSSPLLRLLSRAIRDNGGEVTGHDHATGHGHLHSELKDLIDFWACDTFVTFSEEGRRTLIETARRDLILSGELPNIAVLARKRERETKPGPKLNQAATARQIKTIMYVSGVYRLDRVVYMVRPFSTTLLDWQARLLSKLSQSDYDVIMKVHPDSLFAPPRFFRAGVPAQVEALRFEQVAEQADLFLFDNPLSTTFGHALKSSKPVVLIDFGLVKFTPRGRQLLGLRCAIVEGRTDDDDGRWRVDWDELQDAIRSARTLNDAGFVETYLKAA